MKIQYVAVIFIVIVLPISLVLSQYARVQIDTINLQSKYSKLLSDATYDTIKAFQLNTVNNKYSNVATSKVRDIAAASNTFFKTLGTTMIYTREDLEQHVPALIFTLYDGYYVYTKSTLNDEIDEFSLKPFVYYTEYYENSTKNAIINYTLDNYITVFYYDSISKKYETKSGYYINTNDVSLDETLGKTKIKYKGIEISDEILKENLLFDDGTNDEYSYIKYGNKKVYYSSTYGKYFWYDNYKKMNVNDSNVISYADSRKKNNNLYNRSAVDYYKNAKQFSDWVNSNLGWIEDENNKIVFTQANKDPEQRGSEFNEHRMQVIRKSIETNLVKAIANYNTFAKSYEYELPEISETDWYELLNNVSVITFLQGMPIGSKYFNDYCVITNNKTEEAVAKNSIYMTKDGVYHKIGCPELLENNNTSEYIGYFNLDFVRQTIKNNSGGTSYFYPKAEMGCYHCTVQSDLQYTPDDIINGSDIVIDGTTYKKEDYAKLRKAYLTALAREKQDLYKSNNFGI